MTRAVVRSRDHFLVPAHHRRSAGYDPLWGSSPGHALGKAHSIAEACGGWLLAGGTQTKAVVALLTSLPFGVAAIAIIANARHSKATGMLTTPVSTSAACVPLLARKLMTLPLHLIDFSLYYFHLTLLHLIT